MRAPLPPLPALRSHVVCGATVAVYLSSMSRFTISYKNHRFPPQIIARAVWLYFRFPLSLRLAEEMLLERGIVVSYETIRRRGFKFGAAYAKQLRRKKPGMRSQWR
jgi:putative transposase